MQFMLLLPLPPRVKDAAPWVFPAHRQVSLSVSRLNYELLSRFATYASRTTDAGPHGARPTP